MFAQSRILLLVSAAILVLTYVLIGPEGGGGFLFQVAETVRPNGTSPDAGESSSSATAARQSTPSNFSDFGIEEFNSAYATDENEDTNLDMRDGAYPNVTEANSRSQALDKEVSDLRHNSLPLNAKSFDESAKALADDLQKALASN